MAGLDAFDALADLLKNGVPEAVIAAEDAAAKIYQQAIRSAAPQKTGQLKSSAKIFESKDRKVLSGENRKRVLVGPEKKRGFYGYFLEHGWKAPRGPRVTYTTIRGDRWNPKGTTYTTGRLRRTTGGAASSQMGREEFKQIPARPWFDSAVKGADSAAETAAESAMNAKLSELDGRT